MGSYWLSFEYYETEAQSNLNYGQGWGSNSEDDLSMVSGEKETWTGLVIDNAGTVRAC